MLNSLILKEYEGMFVLTFIKVHIKRVSPLYIFPGRVINRVYF